MAISPLDVKKLRDMTGAGMADCKKALDETNGDFDLAIEILRKKGAATAAKRADKEAKEGVVSAAVSDDNKSAVMVEVCCETDFVARNQEFSSFAKNLSAYILKNKPANNDEMLSGILADGKTVKNFLDELLGKFSENISIRRTSTINSDSAFITSYIHSGDKLGVLIVLSGSADQASTNALGRDLAMQVAAMNPSYTRRSDVSEEVIAKEKEIYSEQATNEGKPAEIAAKIAVGRLEKFYAENCLIEQSYVKDSAKTVTEVLKEFSQTAGKEITVDSFVRFNLSDNVA